MIAATNPTKPLRDFDEAQGLVRLKPLGRTLELKVFYQRPGA
jgi:hypothetical protein